MGVAENDGRACEGEEEMIIAPLELEDLCFKEGYDEAKKENGAQVATTLGKRGQGQVRFNQPLVAKWRMASRAALHCRDPWAEYRISELYPDEECVRHRYSAYRQQWVTDRVCVKMETESFGRGAMRECFRLKKLSGSLQNQQQHTGDNWGKALNYVAKRYLNEIDRKTYFADVQLQADAKLWGEEFNRHNPPKKIDIMQVSILEFVNRPNRPLYHLEHFIEGEYIKYNSNSGFVSDQARQTPQAFSHFTFERSGHQLIVVDVQGVGDLYTDPQIHSADGKCCYGDGDLNTKGMALFFYSHECNSICQSMALTPFDLSPSERALMKKGNKKHTSESKTFCRRGSIELCQSPIFGSNARVMSYLRQRSFSKSDGIEESTSPRWSLDENENHSDLAFETADEQRKENHSQRERWSTSPPPVTAQNVGVRRFRCSSSTDSNVNASENESSGYSTSIELESDLWKEKMEKMRKPSCIPGRDFQMDSGCVDSKMKMDRDENALILGAIHIDLVRYYEMGRFSNTDENAEQCGSGLSKQMRGVNYDLCNYDKAAAWFHLEMAAQCGILEATTTMAKIYLSLPHDLLKDFVMENNDNKSDDGDGEDNATSDLDRGVDLMEEAAFMGDRASMFFMAEAYETGRNLGSERQISFAKSIDWYQKAIHLPEEENAKANQLANSLDNDLPQYKILARIAEMYHRGGPMLSPDLSKAGNLYSEAAEAATEAMQGKLASKLYMLAEEVWAGVEEEE